MDRARGIDVFAVVLIALVVVEVIGAVIGQRQIWIHGDELFVRLFRSPFVPGVIAASVIAFALEGLLRRREEAAMLSRVVALLLVAVGLPVAAFLGAVFGVYSPQHPVG